MKGKILAATLLLLATTGASGGCLTDDTESYTYQLVADWSGAVFANNDELHITYAVGDEKAKLDFDHTWSRSFVRPEATAVELAVTADGPVHCDIIRRHGHTVEHFDDDGDRKVNCQGK